MPMWTLCSKHSKRQIKFLHATQSTIWRWSMAEKKHVMFTKCQLKSLSGKTETLGCVLIIEWAKLSNWKANVESFVVVDHKPSVHRSIINSDGDVDTKNELENILAANACIYSDFVEIAFPRGTQIECLISVERENNANFKHINILNWSACSEQIKLELKMLRGQWKLIDE